MDNEISMSLDDVIKRRIKDDKTGKFRRMSAGRNRRGFRNKTGARANPRTKDTRRRIKVENLNKEIQNDELTKLFQPYGKLVRCGVHYDKLGKSTGVADIEFSTHEECEKAINKLDNAEINGVKARVKYATASGKTNRRSQSAGTRRRNLRKINRATKRISRTIPRRRMVRRTKTGSRTGAGLRNRAAVSRRRIFGKSLGRKRRQTRQKK